MRKIINIALKTDCQFWRNGQCDPKNCYECKHYWDMK